MLTIEAAARKDRTTGQNVELQHRHFAFIAAVLADLDRDMTVLDVVDAFAYACATSNPRFDRARFLKACGVVS